MTDCRWTDAEKVEFEHLFASSEMWSAHHVQKLRALSAAPVRQPDPAVLAALQSMSVDMCAQQKADHPEWLSWMCDNREYFRDCMIKLQRPGDEVIEIYRFIFAMQKPLLVCLMAASEVLVGDRLQSPAIFFADAGNI
eukprot:14224556-Heterocapsa_arctica.AAC.1